ncbi:hypothetical protein [Priestia koreensis]|uniref:hypothetical protein n=1 Tax=Priestia koreensis TaxID=284581 RepID=UPI0028F6DCB5|nr:hypothetical protein [Priestia koreensis]
MKFKLKITTYEYPDSLISDIQTGEIEYSLWGRLDFMINETTFFQNADGLSEEEMGTSSISSLGLTIPVHGFMCSFLEKINDIGNKAIIVDEGQIDKELVMEIQGGNVIFAIRHKRSFRVHWYDGEKVSRSEKMPITKCNSVPIDVFKRGVMKGIKEYLDTLLRVYPKLEQMEKFNDLYKKVSNYIS